MNLQERLSQKELERRHNLIRKKIEALGLDVLLVSGLRFVGSTGYLRYLTNWAEPFSGESLVFPREGTPIFCARTGERAYLVESLMGIKSVTGSTADVVANIIRQTGAKRIGIGGLKTMTADFYVQLTREFADFKLEEASHLLDEARMVKSEEELVWVERSARLCKIALQTFTGLVEEGASEAEVFTEIDGLVRRLGAENTYFMMASDPRPVPKFMDMTYESYHKGDLLLFSAEIAGPAGYYTQLTRTMSLGTPSKEALGAYTACAHAIEAGESLLQPGQGTLTVYKTIRNTVERAGFRLGLHPGHSQGLDIFERPIIDGKDEVELKPGMVIILHPHVLIPTGGGLWVGETFVITPEGNRCLTKTNRELQVL